MDGFWDFFGQSAVSRSVRYSETLHRVGGFQYFFWLNPTYVASLSSLKDICTDCSTTTYGYPSKKLKKEDQNHTFIIYQLQGVLQIHHDYLSTHQQKTQQQTQQKNGQWIQLSLPLLCWDGTLLLHTVGFGDLPGVAQVIRLAEQVMSVHSTRHALTMNKKIALVPWCWVYPVFFCGGWRWKNNVWNFEKPDVFDHLGVFADFTPQQKNKSSNPFPTHPPNTCWGAGIWTFNMYLKPPSEEVIGCLESMDSFIKCLPASSRYHIDRVTVLPAVIDQFFTVQKMPAEIVGV